MRSPSWGRWRVALAVGPVQLDDVVHTAGSRSSVAAMTMPATGPAPPRSSVRTGARRPSVSDSSSTTTNRVGPLARPALIRRGPVRLRLQPALDQSGSTARDRRTAAGRSRRRGRGCGAATWSSPSRRLVGSGPARRSAGRRGRGGPPPGRRSDRASARAGPRRRRGRRHPRPSSRPRRQPGQDAAVLHGRLVSSSGASCLDLFDGGRPRHVAETGPEPQEVGMVGRRSHRRMLGSSNPAHHFGRVGMGPPAADLLVDHDVETLGPELGELPGEALVLPPRPCRPRRLFWIQLPSTMIGLSRVKKRKSTLPRAKYMTPARTSGAMTAVTMLNARWRRRPSVARAARWCDTVAAAPAAVAG